MSCVCCLLKGKQTRKTSLMLMFLFALEFTINRQLIIVSSKSITLVVIACDLRSRLEAKRTSKPGESNTNKLSLPIGISNNHFQFQMMLMWMLMLLMIIRICNCHSELKPQFAINSGRSLLLSRALLIVWLDETSQIIIHFDSESG